MIHANGKTYIERGRPALLVHKSRLFPGDVVYDDKGLVGTIKKITPKRVTFTDGTWTTDTLFFVEAC